MGRTITYQRASILGYARHLRQRHLPLAQVAVQMVLHTGLRRGAADAVDSTRPRLLGRPARTIEEYVREHVASWDRTP